MTSSNGGSNLVLSGAEAGSGLESGTAGQAGDQSDDDQGSIHLTFSLFFFKTNHSIIKSIRAG